MADRSVTFTMAPIEGEDRPPCGSCGNPAAVTVVPDGSASFGYCCGAALCQFNVCAALVAQLEE